jgi:HD superfamily phosphohydrolase
MNNEFFIQELAKEFNISKENTRKLLNKVAKTIKKEKQVTKNLLARTIIHNLTKIKIEEENVNKQRLLSNFKHKCLQKHYYKFLELYKQSWGAKRIENYFKNTLKCSISKAYLDKVLRFLREENNNG